MGVKIGTMSVIMFVIYVFIGLFDKLFDSDLNYGGNSLGNFVLATLWHPNIWSGSVVIAGITVPTMLTVLGGTILVGATILIGSTVLGKSDIVTLFGLFLILMSIGAIPCVSLYSFVTRNVGMFVTDCTIGQPCQVAMIFGAFSAGILMMMWLFSCLEWWLWRSTT
jgi:hypothetical protein